ncbi:MAG: DNA-directed DNA polymerase I [Thaumarchaeota archaeon]|nr:DNA-directed DNA polymerase I [Nitrososphaerota archaeon]
MQEIVTREQDLAKRLESLTKPVTYLEEGLLVSATYDGDKKVAVLKFYDPSRERVWLWEDNTGHQPYCFTKVPIDKVREIISGRNDIVGLKEEVKFDLLSDAKISLRKIIATDPLAIGGNPGKSLRDFLECWEADIKYFENYVYDRGLKVGTYYRIDGGDLSQVNKEVMGEVKRSLDSIVAKATGDAAAYIRAWAELLGQPLSTFKRIALDIEVANEENRIPDPETADREVIAVSFCNDKESIVYMTDKSGQDKSLDGTLTAYTYKVFPDEASLLRATFSKMMDYPFLVTFNGDDFDLRYLKHRALRKEIGIKEEEVPIALQRQEASLKHGVHIDLYRFFNNRSIQVYVYNNKYSEHTLNGIAEALLGKEKIPFDGNIGELPLLKLADYCFNDSQITYELTNANDSLLMKILLVISRIAKMPMNDVARLGVSNWIRSMLYYDHRRVGALIPRTDELAKKGGASSEAIIKGKKYKGGLVIEPKPGTYFGVSVLDFASLYPSIIKVHNLSYETVNCGHEECRSNKVPDTYHWVCRKRSGIESLVIGSLRDLRVGHYKALSKDKTLPKESRDLYTTVTQGLKVILNASYGVMGFETFALYCLPVAEATAALGRDAITRTIEKCNQEGVSVIYSDTDSLFIENPNKDKVAEVLKWAEKELGVELEVDKTYRYVAFSERKKNYFGVLQDGTADIKGLTGKKSQTPQFLKNQFSNMLDILSKVYTQDDFVLAKSSIKKLLTDMVASLKDGRVGIEDLSFNVMMGKSIEGYKSTRSPEPAKKKEGQKRDAQASLHEGEAQEIGIPASMSGLPQHVKAAMLLRSSNKEVRAGELISFVKTKGGHGVKPTIQAKKEDVDVEKYIEYASSMFDQVLSALDLSFDSVVPRTSLDAFWGQA